MEEKENKRYQGTESKCGDQLGKCSNRNKNGDTYRPNYQTKF